MRKFSLFRNNSKHKNWISRLNQSTLFYSRASIFNVLQSSIRTTCSLISTRNPSVVSCHRNLALVRRVACMASPSCSRHCLCRASCRHLEYLIPLGKFRKEVLTGYCHNFSSVLTELMVVIIL